MSELFLAGEQMGQLGQAWRSHPPPAPALAL
jgi:hypothetical protein